MNRFYGWLGVIMLLVQIPITIMAFASNIYIGACYLAILILYLLQVATNVKLRMERFSIYREGMTDGAYFYHEVQERKANGEDVDKAASEAFEQYKNKFDSPEESKG